ncbi:ABC transporter permease [Archangium violaceum]|uniref:ABC transporter permease n=1 Tax=Archangium violaceum TaxID=83451 RepID=UPI0037C02B48
MSETNDTGALVQGQARPTPREWMGALPTWWVPAVALLVLIVGTILIEWSTKGSSTFISPENLLNILRQWSFVGIIAVGMTFVIILGGIDLSVGSLVAFLGGLGILLMNHLMGQGWGELSAATVAFAVMISLGAVAGVLNGTLITRGKLAPFIATLGGLAAYRSLALALADGGEFRSASAEWFKALGTGGLAIPGTNIAPRAPEPIPLLFPWPVVIFFVLAASAWVLLNLTRYGRYVIAIGSNERAAVYSAIPVNRVKLLTYSLLGLCVGISGALLSSRMNSVSSSGTGLLYELDVIAAVVIGGTRMRGGAGTIAGTVIGVLILGVVGNMLNLLQVSVYLQGLVKGVIIIGAVLLQRAERL